MKNLKKMTFPICLTGFLALTMTGCTTQWGGIVPRSKFIYPNSNVTSLGPVKASYKKTSFFIPPHFDFANAKDTYDKALQQVPGANVIIDYREDTSLSMIMFFSTITYTIDGTAAKMEVGNNTTIK